MRCGVHGLRLEAVHACSMWDKAPALSDLVTSNGIDLLGITETWLTPRETSADLAELTPQGFLLSGTQTKTERGGAGQFISSAHKSVAICLQP